MPQLVKADGYRIGEAPADVAITLFTFEHEALPELVRLCDQPAKVLTHEPYALGVTSRGAVFNYVMMQPVLPGDHETGVTTTTISIVNVDRKIGQVLRSVPSPARLTIEIIEAGTPDYVAEEIKGLECVSAMVTDTVCQIEIGRPSYTGRAWPGRRMTKDRFAGIAR